MSFDAHANFAYTTVDTAPTPAASGTALTVATGFGALFPAAPFNAVVYPNGVAPLASNAEILRVTSKGSGDDWTIVRSQEGSSARTILAGDQIAAAITAKTLTDVETAIPSIAGLLSAINVSAGTTSNNLSALTFSDGSGVSFGLNGSVITATVATNYQSQGAYLTTAALSQDSSKYAGTAGAITGGSITVDTSGVSVNLPAYLTTAMASNRGSDFVQATAVFNGTNASGTIASGAISISVAPAAGSFNLSAGTTSNLLSKVTFADSNGVSFGLNASTITATVKTDYQTSGAYLTTAMQSNAATISNINVSGGTTSSNLSAVKFIDSNGVSWSLDTGSKVYATVKTDYQTSGAYLTTAMASNRGSDFVQATAAFHGTNISGTINSNDISLSVAAPTAASINFSAGTTSNNLTQVSFKNTNGVSFGLDAGTITATVATNYQSQGAYLTTAALSGDTSKYIQAWELTGNTSGTTSSLQGTKLYLSGGTNLTISGNSNTLVFSGATYSTIGTATTGAAVGSANSVGTAPRWVAEDHVHAGIGAVGISTSGNTAGTTGSVQGTYWLQGGNSITVSQITSNNGSHTLVISAGNYLTTAALSADSSKYAGTGFTSAGANIGLSGTHNTAGLSLSATVAAQSNQSAIKAFGVSNAGQTAGNTGVSTGVDWVLAGSQSITLSQSTAGGGPNTVWFQHPAWLTTAALSADSSKYAGTGTSATNASITLNTAGLAISVAAPGAAAEANWITLTGNIVGNSSASGSTIAWSGGNGVTLSGTNNSVIGISVSTYSTTSFNTVGPATTVYDVGSSISVGTVTRWANEDHVHGGIGAIGISTSGNTAGTTGSNHGTYWLQGGNQITLSQITSNNGSHTIVVSGPSPYAGYLEPFPMTNTVTLAPAAGSWYFAPFIAPEYMSGGRINFLHVNTSTAGIVRDITGGSYVSSSSGGKNQSYTYSKAAALYSQGTGTNSTRLESFWSNSFSFGLSHRVLVSQSGANSSVSVTVSQSISYISEIGSDGAYTLNQFASNNNSNGTNTSIASAALDSVGVSIRNMLSDSVIIPIGFNTTIQPGAYWMAVAWSSTTASATSQTSFAGASALMFSQIGQVGISRLLLEASWRNWASTATTARSHIMPYGVYTGAANMAPPQFVALSSDLSSLGSAWVPYFNFQNQGITK